MPSWPRIKAELHNFDVRDNFNEDPPKPRNLKQNTTKFQNKKIKDECQRNHIANETLPCS